MSSASHPLLFAAAPGALEQFRNSQNQCVLAGALRLWALGPGAGSGTPLTPPPPLPLAMHLSLKPWQEQLKAPQGTSTGELSVGKQPRASPQSAGKESPVASLAPR